MNRLAKSVHVLSSFEVDRMFHLVVLPFSYSRQKCIEVFPVHFPICYDWANLFLMIYCASFPVVIL